jgi:hypothetical protein
MAIDLSDIVCALAGPMTQRTLDNLRRHLEDLYVKSTAQGVTPEEAAAFSPQLILQAHEAAKWDNANTIVSWAQAIQSELNHAEKKTTYITRIQGYLATAQDKLAFYQRTPDIPDAVVQGAKEEVSQLTRRLRDLSQPQAAVAGHPPQGGPWATASRDGDMDGDLPPVP